MFALCVATLIGPCTTQVIARAPGLVAQVSRPTIMLGETTSLIVTVPSGWPGRVVSGGHRYRCVTAGSKPEVPMAGRDLALLAGMNIQEYLPELSAGFHAPHGIVYNVQSAGRKGVRQSVTADRGRHLSN